MFGPALLFCPADRPERYEKALAAADLAILDLEDAVAAADKDRARAALREHPVDPERSIVRVNPAGTAAFAADLVALRGTGYRTLMLAKTEAAAQLDGLAAAGFEVVALCETARGIQRAEEIAQHPAAVALMWGAEDLVASMGGRSSRRSDGAYHDVARHARSRVLLAAKAAGCHAVDAVHLDIADLDGLRQEALDAVQVGFDATACIHPSQVPVVRRAHTASDQDRDWAVRVLRAAEGEPGVFRFESRMIDEPVLRQARKILGQD